MCLGQQVNAAYHYEYKNTHPDVLYAYISSGPYKTQRQLRFEKFIFPTAQSFYIYRICHVNILLNKQKYINEQTGLYFERLST